MTDNARIFIFAHRFEPLIALVFAGSLYGEMREPTVRSRAVPVRRVGSDLDHVARQQLAGRLALGLIISPAAHGDENLAARMAMPVVAASGRKGDVRHGRVQPLVVRQRSEPGLPHKLLRKLFRQFVAHGKRADFFRYFHILSI